MVAAVTHDVAASSGTKAYRRTSSGLGRTCARDGDFRSRVDEIVGLLIASALGECAGGTCDFELDSYWFGASMTNNIDYELGVRGVQFRVRGDMTVWNSPEGTNSYMGEYWVEVYKDWNFDDEDQIWNIGFAPYNAMVDYGVAKDFAVKGYTKQSYGIYPGSKNHA
ncbi:hypothetical protein ACFO1B_40595 [Dactylosporangium siamense]|uniref:Uncharacterized protein n=1 Tax=Dactylosporangium siamense TaxID=685454 RepID=A0A919UEG7_9ACTN|nr:hypothetical protein [Dactylosporangium siamense]GIG52572.1 hypothetical protein Dsi01nite_106130 [Dactylosporangium siamense]